LTRLGVLVSGRGTNLEAILTACSEGRLKAEVVAVLSNRTCPAMHTAVVAHVPLARVFPLDQYGGDAGARDRAMADALADAAVDLVVCAGYDRILHEDFVERFGGRILNVHPSLLPAFAGTMTAIQDALNAGVAETGVTIHYIEPATVDGGTIVAKEAVPMLPGDTVEALEARIHAVEHRLYPETIQAWIDGRVPRPATLTP
jgi:phosphoribosylglycinamide formyltransferase-1